MADKGSRVALLTRYSRKSFGRQETNCWATDILPTFAAAS